MRDEPGHSDHRSTLTSDSRPIGMLDSGVGGLSVLREVRRLLPGESILYVADQGHMPYGPRRAEEIRAFVEEITRFLLERGGKLIVLPCNAANAAALHHVRRIFPQIPIVGMEPAIKPAARDTRSGVIGVITTQATYQGELFASVIDRFAQGVQVETQVCPDLVLLAEQGAPDTAETRATVARYLAPLKTAGVDQLVLGCTHFPFLAEQIQAYLGPGVTIVDPAPAVARQVGRVLAERGLANGSPAAGHVTYYTTGDSAHFADVLRRLLGENGDVRAATWQGRRLISPD